jgi:hypothetical protein
MPGALSCPVCGRRGATPSEAMTLCAECGAYVLQREPRMLLIRAGAHLTFCSPECLRRHLARVAQYPNSGARRTRGRASAS